MFDRRGCDEIDVPANPRRNWAEGSGWMIGVSPALPMFEVTEYTGTCFSTFRPRQKPASSERLGQCARIQLPDHVKMLNGQVQGCRGLQRVSSRFSTEFPVATGMSVVAPAGTTFSRPFSPKRNGNARREITLKTRVVAWEL